MQARKKVIEKIEEYELLDSWRHFHPDENKSTWTKKTPRKMARLDFFLNSSTLRPFISKTSIEPGTQSDHSITSVTIDFDKFTKGRGFWRFSNALLKDPEHIKVVNNTIRNVTRSNIV